MRTAAVFVSLFAVANGLAGPEKTGECLIDGGEAISDAMDAAMFMWAAIDRCGKTNEEIKCTVGVMSTVQSTTSMINVILRALRKCGDIGRGDFECGHAASTLVEYSNGLGASSGNVYQHCEQNPIDQQASTSSHPNGNWKVQDPVLCVVDLKDSLKQLFKGIRAFMEVEDDCKSAHTMLNWKNNECATDSLKIVAAFTGMGAYLAGTVGHCSAPAGVKGAVCAEASLNLVEDLTKIGQAGIQMSEHCGKAYSRLYSARKANRDNSGVKFASSTNVILAAFIPVTAIAAFVGGRMAAVRNIDSMRDVTLSDNE